MGERAVRRQVLHLVFGLPLVRALLPLRPLRHGLPCLRPPSAEGVRLRARGGRGAAGRSVKPHAAGTRAFCVGVTEAVRVGARARVPRGGGGRPPLRSLEPGAAALTHRRRRGPRSGGQLVQRLCREEVPRVSARGGGGSGVRLAVGVGEGAGMRSLAHGAPDRGHAGGARPVNLPEHNRAVGRIVEADCEATVAQWTWIL